MKNFIILLAVLAVFSSGCNKENFIKKQKSVLMREVVEKLKPKYRTLVEMRYFDELSYEEISAKLDLPLGTVKAQLFRARDLLYNILKSSQSGL